MNTKPFTSYTRIREYAERWTWIDPVTRLRKRGHVVPSGAINPERVPFSLLAVSEKGHRIEGEVVCISVLPQKGMRRVKFVADCGRHKKDDIIWVCDKLIIEIDGVRFVTH